MRFQPQLLVKMLVQKMLKCLLTLGRFLGPRPPNLGEGVVAASVVEEVSASSQAPSEMSGGDMDLDSLDLRDNGLDEVVSQPLPMSGETLFEGVSESASGGGGLRVRPLSRLKRLHV